MADRKMLIVGLLVLFGFSISGQAQQDNYKCDFEKGLCSFLTNSKDNKEKWKTGRGGKEGLDTGPSIDRTLGTSDGTYVFINVTALGHNEASLLGPLLSENYCVRFWYHMYGADVGKLRVRTKEDRKYKAYFLREKSQGDRWKETHFTTSHFTDKKEYQVVFTAQHEFYNRIRGDIALDDIEFTKGECSANKGDAPSLCTFDDNDCNYQAVKTPWVWKKQKSTQLIPIDHTLGTTFGGYWYLYYARTYGLYTSRLVSPSYKSSEFPESCVHFYYYMNADAEKPSWIFFTKRVKSAELRVNVLDSNKNRQNVWSGSKATSKQHTWLYAEAKIETSDSYQIEFEGQLNTEVAAAIAIDDVKVIGGSCPEKGHCNFHTDKCAWTDGDGDILWLRNNGKAGTNKEKGPLKDKTTGTSEGYYVFINILGKEPNSQALLESEIFSPTETTTCVAFWYVMDGERVGSLEVLKREENDTETVLWHLDGDQSKEWLEAYAPSPPSSSSSQIAFRGITGNGKDGCMALDEIRVISGRKCSVSPLKADPKNQVLKLIRCSFDDLNFCEWTQPKDSAQWEFGNVSLIESTGPKQPVNGKGHYIFIHAYDKSPEKSIVAKLKSPMIPSFSPDAVCFSLYYYMFGAHVGELRVFIVVQVDDREERQIFWRRKGTQPDTWLLLQDAINATTNQNFRIEIEAEGGTGFAGDIAIDEISMTLGQCVGTGLCDFESSTCGWKIEASKTKNYYWLRGVQLPKGPETDHTTLTDSGYYLQAVAEKDVLQEDSTNFVSPMFSKNLGSHCLSFWYYREGYAIGKISVVTRTSGGKEIFHWSVTQNVGKSWHYAQVNITVQEVFQIMIQAEKGIKSEKEMAIDDLLLENSVCNAPGACRFNKDYCSYSLNDTSDFAWLLGTGRVLNTQLIDKPPSDRSVSDGMYVYADLTLPSLNPGDKAVLVSEILETPATSKSCVSFYYIVSGADDPKLSVGKMILDTAGDNPVYTSDEVWATRESTGMQWSFGQVPMGGSTKYRVYFEATKGKGHRGFVAVDDVIVDDDVCLVATTAPPQVVTDMPVTPLSCDFDDGTICSWKNGSNKFPFLVNNPKRTRDTMPKFDHTQGNYNGRYAYVNGDITSLKEYTMISPVLPKGWTGKFCFSFWYFMNTDRDGRLYVGTVKNNKKNPFIRYWRQAGHYGYRWRHAYVVMKVEGQRQVNITSRIFKGTVAVDDLAANVGSCPPSKECTFDGNNEMCGFSQDTANNVNWDVKSGEDDDVQYKIVDHTTQSITGQYLYITFNGTDETLSQRSRIFSQKRKPTDASCVTFYYHIYNNSKLALNTYVSTDSGISDPLWSVDQSQGLLWHGARFTAVSKTRNWQMLFEASVSARGYGQMALDDISVETGACPDPGFCDFEDDNCIWENTRSPISQEAAVSKDADTEVRLQRADFAYDDFDWIRHIGEDYYGPTFDHTTGTPEGFYLLLNAREHKFGERAVYLSERLQTTSLSCFRFWHWIPNVLNGATLRVFSSSDFQKGESVQLFKDNTDGKWKEARVSITPAIRGDMLMMDYWIYLAGYVGNNTLGYIALDDLSVEEGVCEDKAKLFECGNGQHVLFTDVCNFRKDCENGLDEANCVDCDFEQNTCGWTPVNVATATFRWIRSIAGQEGLGFDKTKGDASGHFVVASEDDTSWYTNTRANIRSTLVQNSASTCILEFWYNVLNKMDIRLNLRRNKQNTELWIPEERSPYTWTMARVILGRNPSSFSLTFAAKTPDNHDRSHIALDDIATFGCENPGQGEMGYCPPEQFNCKNSVCISKEYVCDYNDDCGNFEDENYENCHEYIHRCSFDQSLCDWTLDLSSNSTWTINKPFESVIEGPTRDHTTGTSTGKFMYLAGKSRLRPARLLGPVLLPSEDCTMRFYFDIRGSESPSLQVKTRKSSNGEEKVVWEARDPIGGFFFIKQQVTFEETGTYQVIIEGSIGLGKGRTNYIALDDVSFNLKCQRATSTLPTIQPIVTTSDAVTCTGDEFACRTMNQCIAKNLVCNFKKECADGSDEDHCGACDFTEDMCGFRNAFSYGGHIWERHQAEVFALSRNTTIPDSDSHGDPNGYFAVVVPARDTSYWRDATMVTPELQETSHSCKLEFFYHFNVLSGYIEIVVQVPGDSFYSYDYLHFQITSSSGKKWQFASVPIGNYRAGIAIKFIADVFSTYTKGRAQDIAVDNIKYVNCDPTAEYEESLNCTFDEDECGWHPDNDVTDLTWIRVKPSAWRNGPSTDRTGNNGYILMMDVYFGATTGSKAHIVSLRQPPTQGRCITLWYHMFGQKVGSLNIMLRTDNETKTIWSKSVSQGNTWRMVQRNIISEDPYSIVIEGIQGDYTAPKIAIDDITVLEQMCPHPVECDFEGDFCDWKPNAWILQMGKGNNPSKDHSTDTEYGKYAVLAEAEGTLTSPVYEFSPNGHCLNFWYFIEGDRSTLLHIRKIQDTSTTDPEPIWADVAHPGKKGEWIHATADIDDLDIGKYMVEFRGRKENESSVVALDDVRIGDGSCPAYGSCTFEADMCTWRNLGYPYSSGLLWLRNSGRLASSLHNSLEVDHTTGTTEGWYIYIDGYYGFYGQTAVLESENLHYSPTTCFEYWYFWNGGVGSLRMVYINHQNGNITTIGSAKTSRKGEWTKFSKLMSSVPDTYKLRLIGTLGSGYSQEIAVDDILIKKDSCDDAITTTPQPTEYPSSPWDCNFESGTFCRWNPGKAWVVQDGRKALVNGSGPTSDHTQGTALGRYAYYSPVGQTDEGHDLVSEPIPVGLSDYCFRFWYYLHSPSPVSLQIYAMQNGEAFGPVWEKKESADTAWKYGRFYFEKSVNTSIFLKAMRSDLGIGDIAIDDIAVNEEKCPILKGVPCDFESVDICGFKTDSPDGILWRRVKASKAEKGPKTDKTFGTKEGHYMIVVPAENSRVPGNNKAHLIMPNLPSTGTKLSCLKFWYQMNGSNVYALSVYVRTPGGALPQFTHWSHTSKHGDSWRVGLRTIDAKYAHEIVFEALMAPGSDGYIALDEVVVDDGRCPPPGSCDFERDMCSWKNADKNVDIEWMRNSGPTPTDLTGPDVDQTIGTAGGSYIYLQAYNPAGKRNLIGILESEFFSVSTVRCLSFWAHMKGSEMGTLALNLTYFDGDINTWRNKTLNSIEGDQGPNWFIRRITISIDGLSVEDEYQLLFIGKTKGVLSDIALDDIDVSPGECYSVPEDTFDCNDGSFVNYTQVCDFEKDCVGSGEDEANCGDCDFEHGDCRWEDNSQSYYYSGWKRVAGYENGMTNPPGYDHTTNTSSGYFMFVDTRQYYYYQTTVLQSPGQMYQFKKSFVSCVMKFYYYVSQNSKTTLQVKKRLGSNTFATLWERVGFEEDWQLGTVYLGTTKNPFHVEINHENSYQSVTVAVDDISFENCGLPSRKGRCTRREFTCSNSVCISRDLLCDLADDCGDGSDESPAVCGKYPKPCTFETSGDCEWVVKGRAKNKWYITRSQSSRSRSNSGPITDHTKGTNYDGAYLKLGRSTVDKKYNQSYYYSPNYVIKSRSSCTLRFFYYMYGKDVASLKVHIEFEEDGWSWKTLWNKDGDLGQMWNRGLVRVRDTDPFHFIIEGVLGNGSDSTIAIDDITLSPECTSFEGNLSLPIPTALPTLSLCNSTQYQCGKGEPRCIPLEKMCDFIEDCWDGSDEYGCGPCDFEKDMCNWKDESSGPFVWDRKNGSYEDTNGPSVDHMNSSDGYFAYIKEGYGFYGSADLLGPPLPPTSSHCVLSFWYYIYGKSVGTFTVQHHKSATTTRFSQLWKASGSQAPEWKFKEVKYPKANKGSVLRFKSDPKRFADIQDVNVAIDEVKFLSCNPTELLLDCDFDDNNFNKGFCFWTQSGGAIMKWIRGKGVTYTNFTGPSTDHTTGGTSDGYYLYINQRGKSPGTTARLDSPSVPMNAPDGSCFSFWYHMYGKHIGSLAIEIRNPAKKRLWVKSRSQGRRWLHGEVNILSQADYKVFILAISTSGEQGNIAIDDVKLLDGPCPRTAMCDFEKDQCGWNSSYDGITGWVRSQGSGNFSEDKPKVDHTTNSEFGYFLYLPRKRHGDLARLESPYYTNIGTLCLKLWYSMFGSDIGTLVVYQRTSEETRIENLRGLWKRSGDHVGVWKQGRVTMADLPNFYIAIEAQTGTATTGYIAIDDVQVIHGSCSDQGSCNFEIDRCGWNNFDAFSDLDWVRRTGSDTNMGYGPMVDHTTSTVQGHYMYAYLTGQPADSRSMLISEDLDLYENYCLSFYYSMYNALNCTLFVQQAIIGMGWNVISQVNSDKAKSDSWEFLETNISVTPAGDFFNLGLTAATLSEMDNITHRGIAVDDISLRRSICGISTEVTTTPAPPITTSYPPTRFDCTFEKDLCLWENGEGRDAVWEINTGHKMKNLTRPRTDHTTGSTSGHYITITSKGWYYYNKAILISKEGIEPTTEGVCFKFWYHMYGNSPGTIALKVEDYHDDSKQETIWTRTGSQGQSWMYEQVHIVKTFALKIVFEGSSTRYGTISLDDFFLNYESCPPRDLCDVEQDFCGYSNDPTGNIQWERGNGSKSSGPDIDHTYGSPYGNYFYVKLSENLNIGDTARLESGSYTPNKRCMRFWYYLYAFNVGTLEIYSKQGDTEKRLWKEGGDNNDFWQGSEVTLINPMPILNSFIFQATIGENITNGIIAIDDISIRDQCPPTGSCTFEEDMCLWTNNPTSDIQWMRGSGEVTDAGPEVDVTFGTQFGTYLYAHILATRDSDLLPAQLLSPFFGSVANRCVNFWSYINGTDKPVLSVIMYDDAQNELDVLQDLSTQKPGRWVNEQVQIDRENTEGKYQIVFQAEITNKVRQFIALDDITVTEKPCTPITPVKPDFTCDNGETHIPDDLRCDFYEDCKDKEDEMHCGLECDFETDDPDPCNWKIKPTTTMSWNRTKAEKNGDPAIEHTKKLTGEGYFMKVTSTYSYNYYNQAPSFYSPPLIQASPICRLYFWYYMNVDSSDFLSVYYTTSGHTWSTVIFRVEGNQGKNWNLAEAVIGRVIPRFQVGFQGTRNYLSNVLGIDDLSFENCAIPRTKSDSDSCKEGEFRCQNGNCVSMYLLCDFADDCGDYSDENEVFAKCNNNPARCDFQQSFCDWKKPRESDYSWERKSAYSEYISYYSPKVRRDHTENSAYGTFLYFGQRYIRKGQVARIASPVMNSKNSSCTLRFFYTYGTDYNHTRYEEFSGMSTLTVYTRVDEINVWNVEFSVNEAFGEYYEKAIIPLGHMEDLFEVIIESRIGDNSDFGGWAIDDVSFTDSCEVSNQTLPLSLIKPTTTQPTLSPCQENQFTCIFDSSCIDMEQVCDFVNQCDDGSDEASCGTCNFDDDSNPTCGWQNGTNNPWVRIKTLQKSPKNLNDVSEKGYFMYVSKKNEGRVSSISILRSTKFKDAASTCEISFYYYMSGLDSYDASLKLQLRDSRTRPTTLFNEVSDQGQHWQNYNVSIGSRSKGWFLEFVATHVRSKGDIAVDEISFIECAPPEVRVCDRKEDFSCGDGRCIDKSLVCDLSRDCPDGTDESNCSCYLEMCDFENGLCTWTHDSTSYLQWKLTSGIEIVDDAGPDRDHTIGDETGHFLLASNSYTWGTRSARIISTPFKADTSEKCEIRLWYHIYGQYRSSLTVHTQVVGDTRLSKVLTIDGSTGDEWVRLNTNVTNRFNFHVVVEGSPIYGRHGEVAIDDITFSLECIPMYTIVTTPVPTIQPTGICESKGMFECEDNDCIDYEQVCDFKKDCLLGGDEKSCPATCNFDDGSTCGWYAKTVKGDGVEINVTVAENAQNIVPGPPPKDHTSDSPSGRYLLIHSSLETETGPLDQFLSPNFSSSASTCKFTFWYNAYLYTMVQTVAFRISEDKSIDMLQLRTTSTNAWNKIEIGVGRRIKTFSLSINSRGWRNLRSYLVVDDIEFIDCALPPVKRSSCQEFRCKKNGACVDFDKVCDMTDDCGDGTDEDNCETYHRTDFESDFGLFRQVKNNPNIPLQWNIGNTSVPGRLISQTGPAFDHTFSAPSGHYAFFIGRRAWNERAWLISKVFSVEVENRCRMTFYYFMYGSNVNQLNIYTRVKSNGKLSETPLWAKSGQEGNYWQRAQIIFKETEPFEVIVEGKAGRERVDVIALDDISFSPECRYISGRTLPPETSTSVSTTTEMETSCKYYEFTCVEDRECIPRERKCDFRKDCIDGSDEVGCVKDYCDFNRDLCNWRIIHKLSEKSRKKRDISGEDAVFRWVNIQANDDTTPEWKINKAFRPKTDHSSNSTEGWYLMADAILGNFGDTTNLTSPLISKTSAQCAIDFWYYCYSCIIRVYTKKEETTSAEENLVWNSRGSTYNSYSYNKWQHAKIPLNYLSNFRAIFLTQKIYTTRSITALDEISFSSCSPPIPPPEGNKSCEKSEFQCDSRNCIQRTLLCDYHGDCYDYSDEKELLCKNYVARCSFENGTCATWHIEPSTKDTWSIRSASGTSSMYSSLPQFDHTTGKPGGRFLSLPLNYYTAINKPKFHSDTIDGRSKNCRVRFWFNNMAKDQNINVYQRVSYEDDGLNLLSVFTTDIIDFWHRGEVTMEGNGKDFQVVFEGEPSGYSKTINMDDISMTPSCQIVDRGIPGKPTEPPVIDDCYPEKFTCDNGNCYTHVQRCNFIDDCGDKTDEMDCGGDCDFDNGTCGWFTPAGFRNTWKSWNQPMHYGGGPKADHTRNNSEGYYMMPTIYSQEFTQLHSGVFVASGPRCKMSLWYYLDGFNAPDLSLIIRYSMKSESKKVLWKLSGPQGPKWISKEADINTQEYFSMIIESSSGVSWNKYIAIDDVKYKECEPTHPPLECVSNEWMCSDESKCIKIWQHCDGKYDCSDKSDEYKCVKNYGDCSFDSENWMEDCEWRPSSFYGNWSQANESHSNLTGPKRNYNERQTGYYIFLNSSELVERGRVAVETPIFNASEGKCHLRFWYYMKGSDSMGMLEVLTVGVEGQESPLWEIDGNQGDKWIYGHVEVGSSQDYRVVFVAERGGDNLTDIALDDVSFTHGCEEGGFPVIPTGPPRSCLEGQFRCVNNERCIPGKWRCDCDIDCRDGSDEDGCPGHCASTGGPKTLPTESISTTTVTVLPRKQCEEGWKLCNDEKTCVPGLFLCDGIKDCPDNSDENFCSKSSFCESTFYFCLDQADPPCIHRDKICDEKNDCTDGSDESFCKNCSTPFIFCRNEGNCTLEGKVPVCECPEGYSQNRCGKKTINPETKKDVEVKKSGSAWIAGVVIGTILLVAIGVLVWFKRNTNVERQRLPNAIENPAYGLNLESYTFGELNAHVPERDAGPSKSPTAIENPLYGKFPKDKF